MTYVSANKQQKKKLCGSELSRRHNSRRLNFYRYLKPSIHAHLQAGLLQKFLPPLEISVQWRVRPCVVLVTTVDSPIATTFHDRFVSHPNTVSNFSRSISTTAQNVSNCDHFLRPGISYISLFSVSGKRPHSRIVKRVFSDVTNVRPSTPFNRLPD